MIPQQQMPATREYAMDNPAQRTLEISTDGIKAIGDDYLVYTVLLIFLVIGLVWAWRGK